MATSMRVKLWSARAALLVGSTTLCAVGAELIVRAGGWAPQIQVVEITGGLYRSTDDPSLPYIPNPGHGDFNSYGVRGKERSAAPRPDGRRIVALGDSILFGGGSSGDQIFTARLEQHLKIADERLSGIEVWNFGVAGYDTVNEVALFERKGVVLQPQLVIVGYCINDMTTISTELTELLRNPKHREQQRLRAVMARSALAKSELLRLILWRLEPEPSPDALTAQPKPYANVERGFSRLRELANEHGFEVVVVVFPFLEPYSHYRHGKAHRRVAAIAARHRFAVLDLLPIFRATFRDDMSRVRVHAHDRIHLNAAGHDLAARTTAGFLLPKLLPAAAP